MLYWSECLRQVLSMRQALAHFPKYCKVKGQEQGWRFVFALQYLNDKFKAFLILLILDKSNFGSMDQLAQSAQFYFLKDDLN